MVILSALLLASVVSIDTLAAGFAYGTSSIKVPIKKITVLNIICSAMLGLSLFLGLYIRSYIPTSATVILSAAILVTIGAYKIIQSFRKTASGIKSPQREIKWAEALILSLLLSIDGFAVGIGVSIHNTTALFCLYVLGFSLIAGFAFFSFGQSLGKKITKKTSLDLSWLSGIVLIILGIIKFF